jgi:hypothetical protein
MHIPRSRGNFTHPVFCQLLDMYSDLNLPDTSHNLIAVDFGLLWAEVINLHF